ncbi:MAG TPA: aromatic ring-hydroxylating dioxygenase subunit alpha [Candidatus Bathyarchaeia archaeon]|nr:aromatic ring-hydroxylating dioxygenase subunit alpha [Candidatus Bathyarchaeia archaeon]
MSGARLESTTRAAAPGATAKARTPMHKAPDPDLGRDLIPKTRYTSRDFAQLEWEGMWRRVWLLAGRESDIPEPGDYFTFEIGPESILVIRQVSGSIAARYNVCMHRGNRLREAGLGHASAFSCLFHGWKYGLDGTLLCVTDPESFPQGAPRERLDLRPVRCDTWGGFVWINLDPGAGSLADYLGMIPEHLDPYHFEEQSIVNDITIEVDCNWKTCVDAFNEAYHVQSTHPGLMQYSDDVNVQIDCYERHSRFLYPLAVVSPRLPNRGEVTEPIREMFLRGIGLDPDRFTGRPDQVRPAIAKQLREVVGPVMGVDFSDLNDDQMVDDYHYTIFPNVTLNIHARGVWVFRHRPHPDDPNRMYFDFLNLLRAPRAAIERPEHEHGRLVDGYSLRHVPGGDVLDEDMYNLPRVQAGMRSSAYPGLHLGTQELRIRHFHHTLEQYLQGAGGGRSG